MIHWFVLVHWFVESLIHWFIHSLIVWFIDSLIRWFTDSLVGWFIGSLLGWFTDSLIHWVIHWFTDRLIFWFVDSLTHCFNDSSGHWLIGSTSDSLILMHCFVPWSIHRFIAQWFTDSWVHSVSYAWILSCPVIGTSTTICSVFGAPHNFNISWLLHLKSCPKGHLLPLPPRRGLGTTCTYILYLVTIRSSSC